MTTRRITTLSDARAIFAPAEVPGPIRAQLEANGGFDYVELPTPFFDDERSWDTRGGDIVDDIRTIAEGL